MGVGRGELTAGIEGFSGMPGLSVLELGAPQPNVGAHLCVTMGSEA